jgi:hypothetical protein
MAADGGGNWDWVKEADPIYIFLGLYLTLFQALESKLDHVIAMAGGFDNWEATQVRLARMDNNAKVAAFAVVAVDIGIFPLLKCIPEWSGRIEALTSRLHAERLRRNTIMHSQYLLDGVEDGFAPIRSLRTRAADPGFDQESLDRSRMDTILRETAELLFAVSNATAQLIQALPRSEGAPLPADQTGRPLPSADRI